MPARKSVADLLLAAVDHRQLPAHLHVGRPGGSTVHAARLHEDVRDVRGRDAVDHSPADGALLKGRFRTEATNPVSRLLTAVYRPIAVLVVRFRIVVVAAAVLLMIATVPTFQRLGSEFMPPLDEGSLLVMPTTFPVSPLRKRVER